MITEKGGSKMKITPIRLLRLDAKIDSKQAMERLNISESTFYKIEQGYLKPSRELVWKMSKLYNCSTDKIFEALIEEECAG